jgi:FkbM family methyltransferase
MFNNWNWIAIYQSTKQMKRIAWNKILSPGILGFCSLRRTDTRLVSQRDRCCPIENRRSLASYFFLPFTLCLVIVLVGWSAPAIALAQPEVAYEQRTIHNPDGIGKIYLGREIAQVMGHQGAGWLERPSREDAEQPQKLLDILHIKPTDTIADIGAGTGYFSFRMAALVPEGRVLAVDVQPEMVKILNALKAENHAVNVEPRLGKVADPELEPTSVDLALMVDAYHEFEYPREMMMAIAAALKPNGRVALVEYRGEDPLVFIKPLHKMTQRQVRKEMAAVGLRWLETQKKLPQQHVMIFGKPTA